MIRISSLPIQEFCPMSNKIGQDQESVNAKRSTCFHSFCETGVWPEQVKTLPESDFDEIKKWKPPISMRISIGDAKITLKYEDSLKEVRVAVDKDFNYIEVPSDVPQKDIAIKHPDAMIVGTCDMVWYIPEFNLVVVNDIKSSIFAVKARTKSLQLHGYGISFARKMGATRYLVALYDASEGRHYIDDSPVDLDSWECEEYKGRITAACANQGESYVKGTHCGGCWKRDICPAHLVELPGESEFAKILGPSPTEADVRQAMVALKGRDTLNKKVDGIIKDWVQRHGPVRSEDGKKVYKAILRNGRSSLDQKAVQEALGVDNLDKYMKQGNDFIVYDWLNNKE